MMLLSFPLPIVLSLVLLAIFTTAHVQTISAVGSKFFYEDGTQFFMKGIAYQLTPHDPLIDTEQCILDVALMSQLGVNAIRVYHVDPQADHRGCMDALADAGIYLFVDLDTFETQIEQGDPHWNETQFERFQAVLDEFQDFPNTAGVFVGNEVLTTKEGSAAAPYILAAARDIKVYRDNKDYRKVPVGYSAADIAELRPMLQNYFACFDDPYERLDFFALNAYEWCGPSSYSISGYNILQKNATGYPIPIFFSETGCNTVPPRTFEDQAVIFGEDMSGTWSGSIVYEWIEETNDYGLISYGPPTDKGILTIDLIEDGFTRKGTPTPVGPDFQNLQSQWATLHPTGVHLTEYIKSTDAITRPQCPSPSIGWSVDPNSALPTLGQTYTPTIPTETAAGPGAPPTGTQPLSPKPTSKSSTHGHDLDSVSVAGIASADQLVIMSVVLCSLVGFTAFWL